MSDFNNIFNRLNSITDDTIEEILESLIYNIYTQQEKLIEAKQLLEEIVLEYPDINYGNIQCAREWLNKQE